MITNNRIPPRDNTPADHPDTCECAECSLGARWWTCPKCGHLVLDQEQPQPIKWTDGHVCHFRLEETRP